MTTTNPTRVKQTGSFEIDVALHDAFKLFTAEGERLWVPGWSPRILGAIPQAPGLVFLTGDGPDQTIWVVVDTDAPRFVRYARTTPGSRAGFVEVRLAAHGDRTRVDVTYDLTALSDEGARALDDYEAPAYAQMMDAWRAEIEAFLATPDARARLSAALV